MADLSPAALAVRDAAEKQTDLDFRYAPMIAAAALRAAADQAVPEPAMILRGGRTYEAWTATVHSDIRNRFLAIADELEGRS